MKTGFIILMLSFLGPGDSMKNADWYSVKFQSLCDELGRNVTPERALKFGKLMAYLIQQDSVASDTIRVSFDFISNCCEIFESKAEIVNETLNISYYKTNTETCRCLCDYRFTYSISDTTKVWNRIKVYHLKGK